jgi:flagellar hook assembly protein FlgD
VGGVRGYINPKRGESATFLLKPTGSGTIRIRIYDEEGILVREMVQSTGGGHTEAVQWQANDSSGNPVAPGLYPVLIEAPGIRYRDKLVVIH